MMRVDQAEAAGIPILGQRPVSRGQEIKQIMASVAALADVFNELVVHLNKLNDRVSALEKAAKDTQEGDPEGR